MSMIMPMLMRMRMRFIHNLSSSTLLHLLTRISSRNGFLGIPGHAKGSSSGIRVGGEGLLFPFGDFNVCNVSGVGYLWSAGCAVVSVSVFVGVAMIVAVERELRDGWYN